MLANNRSSPIEHQQSSRQHGDEERTDDGVEHLNLDEVEEQPDRCRESESTISCFAAPHMR